MKTTVCNAVPNNVTSYVSIHIIKKSRNRSADTQFIRVCIALMASFIVIAALQAFQLNALLSETKNIKSDFIELQAEQASISHEYAANTTHFKKLY